MRRLFIAIELPDAILDSLEKKTRELKKHVSGRYTTKDKFHITILFLGDPKNSDEDVINAVRSVPIDKEITLSGLGMFRGGRERILFAAVQTDLSDIYRELCDKLGIRTQEEFKPHITLCRTPSHLDLGELEKVTRIKESFYAAKLSLFSSDMRIYTRLY